MVTQSRRSAFFYCYARCLELFIIVTNNALCVKIHENVVLLFYDVILKYDVNAYTHIVANGFLILFVECKQVSQMASTAKLEIRAIIKFCQQQGDTPSKMFEKIAATHGKNAVSRTVVFDWHKHFKEGNTSLTDKEGRGRKKKVTTTLVTLVANALESDRRLTVRAVMAKFDVSYGTMQTILTRDLKMRKVKNNICINTLFYLHNISNS